MVGFDLLFFLIHLLYYFDIFNILLSLPCFNMVCQHKDHFKWLQRMAWMKPALFWVFSISDHPPRSRVHLITRSLTNLLSQITVVQTLKFDFIEYKRQLVNLPFEQLCSLDSRYFRWIWIPQCVGSLRHHQQNALFPLLPDYFLWVGGFPTGSACPSQPVW